MARYYKLLKDHPVWEKGAILSNEANSDQYAPVQAIWCKTLDNGDEMESFYECDTLVENCKEWFERVHKVSIVGKAKYLSREAARKAHDALYSE